VSRLSAKRGCHLLFVLIIFCFLFLFLERPLLFKVRVRSQTKINSAGSRASLNMSVTDSWKCICHDPVADFRNDVIDIGASLGKHVCCLDLKDGQSKSWRACGESSLGNCCLESTSHAWQYKVLVCPNVVGGVLLACRRDSWLGDCFPPASVGHTN
jgi:hypothetical protein